MKKDYSINYLLIIICIILAVFVIVNAKIATNTSAKQAKIDNVIAK